MLKALLLTGTLILTSFVSSAANTAPLDRDMIPDQGTAIRVASAILETYLGKSRFDEMRRIGPLKADLEGDTWTVYSWPDDLGKIKTLPNGGTVVTVVAGSDYPAIELSKHTAQVTDISYRR